MRREDFGGPFVKVEEEGGVGAVRWERVEERESDGKVRFRFSKESREEEQRRRGYI